MRGLVRLAGVMAPIALLAACGGSDSSSGSGSGGGGSPVPPADLIAPLPMPTPAATPAASVTPAAPSARPNILFIFVDDMRPELGVYGSASAVTPRMDKLAAEGAVFEHAYASVALCAPSRTALLTAMRPESTGVFDNSGSIDTTLPQAVTLADSFKAAGYKTIRLGKVWHNYREDEDSWSLRIADAPSETRPGGPFANSYLRLPDDNDLQDTGDVAKAVAEFPKLAQNPGTPFFFAFGLFRPHMPFLAPKSSFDRASARQAIPTIANKSGAYNWTTFSWEMWQYTDLAPYRPTIPSSVGDQLRLAYSASVNYVDDMVGTLLDALQANGLANNTIVVLWGDHGFKLGDYGSWSKADLTEVDLRTPLIIRAPGRVAAGTRIGGLVEAVDVYPTLAQLAGVPVPAASEGLSFVPLLSNPTKSWKQATFSQMDRTAAEGQGNGALRGYALRTADYKYIAWVAIGTGRVVGQELYDLHTDPKETVNVAKIAKYSQVLSSFEQLRQMGWRSVRDAVAA